MEILSLCTAFLLSTGLVNGLPDILLANRRDVQIIDIEAPASPPKIVQGSHINAINADFLFEKQQLFVSDTDIHRIWLNESRDSDTIITELDSYKSLACDWLTEKIYVVDPDFKRVEVVTLDGVNRKVLIWEGLDKPRSIAVDPNERWMFVTDWGNYPKIERCGMDGDLQTRSAIVNRRLKWPNGITLDYEELTIYWTDAGLQQIESCSYDGSNRRTVLHIDLLHPFGISVFQDKVFWTDWITRSIYSCNKVTGDDRELIISNRYLPIDIRVVSPERQRKGVNVTNACVTDNGGCSHLCLLSPTSPFYTCACPTGLTLLDDKRTCQNEYNEFLLVARQKDVRILSLDTPELLDINLPIKGNTHAVAIAHDPVDKMVYWTDNDVPVIRRAHLGSADVEDIVTDDLLNPESLAIDWIAGNLYFIDSWMDTVEVSTLDGSFRKALITENLDEPRAICVDPVHGFMFWTDAGFYPKITRSNMDGTGQTVIVNTSLTVPSGIAVDYTAEKIYWGDDFEYKIEEANFDGSDRKTIFTGEFLEESISRIFGFSLSGDYIYWTDQHTDRIERINIKTREHQTILSGRQHMMGVAAVQRYGLQGTNGCAIRNGGCSHLCLMRPGRHVCACPSEEILDRSRRNCVRPYRFRYRYK